jgi:hypothetical protein
VERPRTAEAARPKGSRRRRKPLRSLRVALAGAVLIACAHLVVSAASTPTPEMAARPRTPRRLIVAPPETLKDVTPRTVAAVMPVLQTIPVPGLNSSRSPAPTLKPVAPSSDPADSAMARDSAPEIQPAPDAAGISTTVPAASESLAPQVVDSTGKKALRGILRTIGGSPAAGTKLPKR